MLLDPLVIVRTVHFAACTVALGTLVLALLERTGVAMERRLRQLALSALAVAGLSGALWLGLIARNILDVPLAGVFDDGGLASVALDTRFGRIACLRLVLVVTAAGLLLWAGRWPAFAATTALMASIAWTGHAGAGTGWTGLLHLASDVVHLVAAGIWLGALPALASLLLWSRSDPARGALGAVVTRRFGTIALAAVATLLASGIVNTAVLVGWPADPLATTYAQALAVKIGLFAAMLVLAAINRFRLTPALPQPRALRALALGAVAETALGLGALLVVGLLGTQPPAAHVHTTAAAINGEAAFVHIHTSQMMADFTLNPGRAGVTTATIQLWHEDYRPYAADRVRLTLRSKNGGATPVSREGALTGDGTWVADNLRMQSAGEWRVRMTIERAGTSVVLDATVVLAQCSNDCW